MRIDKREVTDQLCIITTCLLKSILCHCRLITLFIKKVSESALSGLKKGDKVKLSIEFYREDLNYLYSMSCRDVNILSYKDYVEAHTENDKYGHIICPVLFSLGMGLFIAEIVHYKKTGRSLQWPRSI